MIGTTGWLSRSLNLLGAVVVVYSFIRSGFVPALPAWIVISAALSVLSWAVFVLTPPERITARIVVGVVAVAGGALATGPSDGMLLPPVAVVLITLTAELRLSVLVGVAMAVLAGVLTPIGCAVAGVSLEATLALEASTVIWLLIGLARRQALERGDQARQLGEQQLEAREEHARAELLAARQTAARDIHDVLAHSLGGLVVQLDAVDALLEAGRTADAAARVSGARRLAAEGLADARRAVAALRSPDADADTGELDVALPLSDAAVHLVETHRSLGGAISFEVDPAVDAAPPAVARALERALQESLSNARRHAPGLPVEGALLREGDELRLVVANPVPPAASAEAPRVQGPGGGHGLHGMAERFAALPGGAVSAQARGARFVVEARARA